MVYLTRTMTSAQILLSLVGLLFCLHKRRLLKRLDSASDQGENEYSNDDDISAMPMGEKNVMVSRIS